MAAAAFVVLQAHEHDHHEHHDNSDQHSPRSFPGTKESLMGSALGRLEEHLHKLQEAQKVFKIQTESHWDKLQEQGRHLNQEVAALRQALSKPPPAGGGAAGQQQSHPLEEKHQGKLRPPHMPPHQQQQHQQQQHNQQQKQLDPPQRGQTSTTSTIPLPTRQDQQKAEDNELSPITPHSYRPPTTPSTAGGDKAFDANDSDNNTLAKITSTPQTPGMAISEVREQKRVHAETRVRWLGAMGDGLHFKSKESNKWRWCHPKAWREAVSSPFFDLLVGILIVANTVSLSLKVEYEGWVRYKEVINCKPDEVCHANVENVEFSFEVLEQAFTALFAFELLMRIAAEGRAYIRSAANIGDALIVVISCVDSWILVPSNQSFTNVSVIRMVKLLRLLKVLRVVRVMRAFKSLRVMVSAVAASIGALAWSMTLLFALELLGAIFLAQVLAPYVEDANVELELREWLWNRFGTWTRSMLSIFEITMAPGGFVQYRRLHDEVHPMFFYFIVVYVSFVTFAVVRVITAMFLKATLSAAEQDDASIAVEKAETNKAYVKRLQDFIEEADTDRPGYIQKGELIAMLDVPRMQDWLEDVELPKGEAERLFHALDPGDGCIQIDEFLNALTRMRGAPRAADMVVGLYESRKILDHLTLIEDCLVGGTSSRACQGFAERKSGQYLRSESFAVKGI